MVSNWKLILSLTGTFLISQCNSQNAKNLFDNSNLDEICGDPQFKGKLLDIVLRKLSLKLYCFWLKYHRNGQA